jgi:hypothetical protein
MNCYCHTCQKVFKPLGIAAHRAAHRRRNENCKITYSDGKTEFHKYDDKVAAHKAGERKEGEGK